MQLEGWQKMGTEKQLTIYEGINLDPSDAQRNELNMRLVSCLQSFDPSCVMAHPKNKNIDQCMAEIDQTFGEMDRSELMRQKNAVFGKKAAEKPMNFNFKAYAKSKYMLAYQNTIE